jgi:hypothetical protein
VRVRVRVRVRVSAPSLSRYSLKARIDVPILAGCGPFRLLGWSGKMEK